MKDRYEDQDREFDRLMRLRWALLITGVFVFLLGLSIFGVCLWIRFDLDFREWVRELDWYSYWYCMYVVMIAMVVVIVNTAFHLYGVVVESTGWFVFNNIFFVVAIIMEFTGAVVICMYGVEESKVLTKQLQKVFFEMVWKSDHDPRAMRMLRIVQEYVGCCGARGSEDYLEALKPVPVECRDPVTGREYAYGCMQQLAWYVEPWTATLAAACIALILLHIAQVILSRKMARCAHKIHYNYEYN